jgi:hypothetical protein
MDDLDYVTMELFPCVGKHMQKLMMDSSPTTSICTTSQKNMLSNSNDAL